MGKRLIAVVFASLVTVVSVGLYLFVKVVEGCYEVCKTWKENYEWYKND